MQLLAKQIGTGVPLDVNEVERLAASCRALVFLLAKQITRNYVLSPFQAPLCVWLG